LEARALGGFVIDKQFKIVEGERCAGKSFQINLCQGAFKGYVKAPSSNRLLVSTSQNVDVKDNGWLIDFISARFMLFSEVLESGTIDGLKIKSINSGGDILEGRKNYKDAIEFPIQGTMSISLNKICKFSTKDSTENAIIISLKNKFVEAHEINDLNRSYVKIKDDDLKKYAINDVNAHNAYLHIVLDHFKNKKPFIKDFEDVLTDTQAFKFISQHSRIPINMVSIKSTNLIETIYIKFI